MSSASHSSWASGALGFIEHLVLALSCMITSRKAACRAIVIVFPTIADHPGSSPNLMPCTVSNLRQAVKGMGNGATLGTIISPG